MVKTKSTKVKPNSPVDRSPDLKSMNTIMRSTTPKRSTMRSVGSEGKDRQINQTVQSKIRVKEEYDQELNDIAMLKTEYDPRWIASMEIETTGKPWEHAKAQFITSI